MPTQNVNLSEQQARFVRDNIDRGGFRNASEVVRAALRLMQHQQRIDKLKLQRLRRLAKVGFDQIDRGEYVDVDDVDEFMDKISARVEQRIRR
jgi:antitoxin ParD1/3/4